MVEQRGRNRASDARGTKRVLDGVFVPQHYGNSSTKYEIYSYSFIHTQRRDSTFLEELVHAE